MTRLRAKLIEPHFELTFTSLFPIEYGYIQMIYVYVAPIEKY